MDNYLSDKFSKNKITIVIGLMISVCSLISFFVGAGIKFASFATKQEMIEANNKLIDRIDNVKLYVDENMIRCEKKICEYKKESDEKYDRTVNEIYRMLLTITKKNEKSSSKIDTLKQYDKL